MSPYQELSDEELNELLIKYRSNLARLLNQAAASGLLATDLSIQNHIEGTTKQLDTIKAVLLQRSDSEQDQMGYQEPAKRPRSKRGKIRQVIEAVGVVLAFMMLSSLVTVIVIQEVNDNRYPDISAALKLISLYAGGTMTIGITMAFLPSILLALFGDTD